MPEISAFDWAKRRNRAVKTRRCSR